MNMVFIHTYLNKMDFMPFTYSQTCFFQCSYNAFLKYFSPVFCWTYNMIQQEILIMSLQDVFTHPDNITPE